MSLRVFEVLIFTVVLFSAVSIPAYVSAANVDNSPENDSDENENAVTNASETGCCTCSEGNFCCWDADTRCCREDCCEGTTCCDDSLKHEYPVLCCQSDSWITYCCSTTSLVLGSLGCAVLVGYCCFECCIDEKLSRRRNRRNNWEDSDSSVDYVWSEEVIDVEDDRALDTNSCYCCNPCGCIYCPCGCINPCYRESCKCSTGPRFCQGIFMMTIVFLVLVIAMLVREQRKYNDRDDEEDSESDEDSDADVSSSDDSASSVSTRV